MLIDPARKEIIQTFMLEAKKKEGLRSGTNPDFSNAVGLVEVAVAFEAFIDELRRVRSIKEKRENFSAIYQDFFVEQIECLRVEVEALKEELDRYPLEDMTANTTLPSIIIDNLNNLSQIIEVVYRVRSNLIHGSKLLTTARNRVLIGNSFHFLYRFMELVFAKEGI